MVAELSELPYSGWNKKEGRGDKDFKKGSKLRQGVDVLKRVGLKILTNYVL